MKKNNFTTIIIIFLFSGLISLANADDPPLPSLEEYVEKNDGMKYILKRCHALYKFHATILGLGRDINENYDDTNEIHAYKNAMKISLFNEVRYPDNQFLDEEQEAMISAYMRTKTIYIQDDNSICNEVVDVIEEWSKQ